MCHAMHAIGDDTNHLVTKGMNFARQHDVFLSERKIHLLVFCSRNEDTGIPMAECVDSVPVLRADSPKIPLAPICLKHVWLQVSFAWFRTKKKDQPNSKSRIANDTTSLQAVAKPIEEDSARDI